MVGQQEPVVTGDAVVLDVQIAQLPIRALSAMIDCTVVFVAYVIGVLLWATMLSEFDTALSAAVLIIFTVLALVGYPTVFETATRGRSLGKIALGLRVVSADGGPERFRQALFRALAGVIEIWIFAGGPAVICSLLSPKGKRLGDIFAGTIVISERAPRLTPPPPMPPQLAWWASSLQLSGLGVDQAELARQFLSRASQLDSRVAIRWHTGSPVMSSHRYRPRPRPPLCHNWCWPRCWPSVIVGNWRGCARSRRSVPLRSGRRSLRISNRCRRRRSRQPTPAGSLRRASFQR
jgi:uncharacterized RDD family membrane protein YckC